MQFAEMREILRSMRPFFFGVGAFSFVINLLQLTAPLYMLQVYDRVLNSRNEMTLLMLTILVVALFLVMAAIEFVRALLSPGRVPFARTSALYIGFGLVGWAAVLLGAAQMWRIARANRGLEAQVTLWCDGPVEYQGNPLPPRT